MQQHDNLILMGQDIAEYGGAFKVTEGFVNEFGKERVRNTPLCESAIVGAALGLSLAAAWALALFTAKVMKHGLYIARD